MALVELVTPYHTRTKRDYLARMLDDKVHCMEKAREYGFDYWDGDRRYGYGGYRYIEGYWKPLAQRLVDRYRLEPGSRVLDVGCGKAHILHELATMVPGLILTGFDPSEHGLEDAPVSVRSHLQWGRAQDRNVYHYWTDRYFDLVLAMGSLHNLKNWERDIALKEIERVGKQKYLWVESYRNATEQFNLQCWALTCWAFQTDEEWVYEFQRNGYTGDYEFVYFT